MIVIAVHDELHMVEALLNQLISMDTGVHDILVVDTNSTNPDFIRLWPDFASRYPSVKFDRKDRDCWDSGAYIHAYKTYERDSYIFLQDSLEITNLNLIKIFDEMLLVHDVVPIFNFIWGYDDTAQQNWVENDLNLTGPMDKPEFGIFGPIFAVTRETMDKLPKEWLDKIPENKKQGCGMERRWSMMFHKIGATKKYLDYIDDNNIHQVRERHDYIKKIFNHRN